MENWKLQDKWVSQLLFGIKYSYYHVLIFKLKMFDLTFTLYQFRKQIH